MATLSDKAAKIAKKIIQKEGNFYLVSANQTLTDLSIEEKSHAHQAYLVLKSHIETTHVPHAEQQASPAARTWLLQQDILQLANQRTHIQASIAQISTIIDPTHNTTEQTTPRPTLTPQSTSKKIKPPAPAIKRTPAPGAAPSPHPSCSYRFELGQLRNKPQLQQAAQLKIQPGVPMSPMLLQAILRYNNGMNAQRLEIASPIKSPYKSPSPFDLEPKP